MCLKGKTCSYESKEEDIPMCLKCFLPNVYFPEAAKIQLHPANVISMHPLSLRYFINSTNSINKQTTSVNSHGLLIFSSFCLNAINHIIMYTKL